jgi:hypothetical protein
MAGGVGRFKAAHLAWAGDARRAIIIAMRTALLCFVLTLAAASAAFGQTADPLQRAADAYASFELDVGAITAAQMDSYDRMDAALLSAARHDSAELSRGWIAYAALTAAQSPAFVHGVQSRVRAAGRAPVLQQFMRDTTYARRRPPGAAEALRLMLDTLSADAVRLSVAADRYDRLSDAMQSNSPFGGASDAQRAARDQRLRAAAAPVLEPEIMQRIHLGPLGAAPMTDAAAFGGAHFWDGLAGLSSAPNAPMHARDDRQALTDRMLTLAGLFIIGATPQANTRVDALLDDRTSRDCLHVQQLEFRQCVSVSHTPDEDAACLARHGLRNVAACLSF